MGDVRCAEWLVADMIESNLEPDAATYNGLIQACAKAGTTTILLYSAQVLCVLHFSSCSTHTLTLRNVGQSVRGVELYA